MQQYTKNLLNIRLSRNPQKKCNLGTLFNLYNFYQKTLKCKKIKKLGCYYETHEC